MGMYSEYKVIDCKLHHGMPGGEWRLCTNAECVKYYEDRIDYLEQEIFDLGEEITSLEDDIENMESWEGK
jgi:hypothetical protein